MGRNPGSKNKKQQNKVQNQVNNKKYKNTNKVLSSLNKEELTREIKRCKSDVNYFLSEYAKIQHPVHGLIDFKLFDYQRDFNNALNENRFNIVLKSRQLGMSTAISGYIIWFLLFHADKTVLILSNKKTNAQDLIKKIKIIYNNLPDYLKPYKITTDNLQNLSFSNGSSVRAESTTTDAAISNALSLLVIDEAAVIDGFDELWKSAYPTISAGGRCVIISTPRGVGSQYHELWVGAEAGTNGFNPIKLMWDVHPDRDQKWFEDECRTAGYNMKLIAREYLCSFESSGETFLDSDTLSNMVNNIAAPIAKELNAGRMWVYEFPEPNCKYVLSADVSRGDSDDYSAFSIINSKTYNQVADFKDKIATELFALEIMKAAKMYNNATIVVESNAYGFNVLSKIKEANYPNLFFQKKSSAFGKVMFSTFSDASFIAGFTTDSITRPIILERMNEYIRNKLTCVKSSRLHDEFKTFIYKNGRASAQKGYNDDLVLSFAIAIWVTSILFPKSKKSTSIAVGEEEFINPFNFTTSVSFADKKEQYKIQNIELPVYFGNIVNNTSVQRAIDQTKEYDWLLS